MDFPEYISVLLIEDNPGDAELIEDMLDESEFGIFNFKSAETLNEGLQYLKNNKIHVLLLDLNLPDSTDMDTLFMAHEKFPELPIVIFTGSQDEKHGLEALNKGAQDYLTKGHVNSYILSKSIFYSIERKKNERKLNELIEELERSNNELQQFAYITSHDLQEPLRTISNFTRLLERRCSGKMGNDADDYIHFIVDGAERMNEMIQDLLEFSRVGIKPVELEKINIEDVFKTVLFNLNASIEENRAIITHDSLPLIFADKNQMERLFQNLIGNAIKFRKKDEPPRIHISAHKEDSQFIFSIADNGIGMELEFKDEIFEVFKRLHTIDTYSGTGIGLSICKRIIERHGGDIWVESKLNEGSTFYFSIPLRDTND